MQKKVYVLGDDFSGKTSIISQWIDDVFPQNAQHTIAVSFKIATCELENVTYDAKIIEMPASQSGFSSPVSAISQANGCLIVLDITNPNSLQNLQRWIQIARGENLRAPIVVVGNKVDLLDDISAQSDAFKAECVKFGVSYFDVSAKTNYNVDEAFQELMNLVAYSNNSITSNNMQQNTPQVSNNSTPMNQEPYARETYIDDSDDENHCCRI